MRQNPFTQASIQTNRDIRQRWIGKWAVKAFGKQQATEIPQRGLRLLEEATEAAQAAGVTLEMAQKLTAYVYGRPVGELFQEMGGVGVTLLALGEAAGIDADDAEITEVNRIIAKPIEHFTKRNQLKNDAGFLVTK